jgi:hypothetical protein
LNDLMSSTQAADRSRSPELLIVLIYLLLAATGFAFFNLR